MIASNNQQGMTITIISDESQSLVDKTFSTPNNSSIQFTYTEFGQSVKHYLAASPMLLLIDCRRDNALALIRQLRAQGSIPIVALVDTENHTVLDQLYAAGIDDYLTFPIHPATFAQRIQRLHIAQPKISTAHETQEQDVWTALYGLSQVSHIYEIGRGLIRSMELQSNYDLIYDQIVQRVLYAEYLNVVLLDEEEQCFACVYAKYNGQPIDINLFPPIFMPHDGLEALIARQQIQTFDIDEADHVELQFIYSDVPASETPRAVISIPLISHDRVLGFLISQTSHPDTFADLDQNLLTLLVSSVTVAIENAQMQVTNQQQINELESLYRSMDFLFEAKSLQDSCLLIAQAVVESFEQADCGVILVEEDSGHLVRQGRAGDYTVHASQTLFLDGPGLVPEAIRTRQMIYVPDVTVDSRYVRNEPRTYSELVIPMITPHGAVIGALDLQSMRTDAFSISDRRVIMAFAERAALAIENAQIHETNRQQIKELETLYRSMNFLFKSKNLIESCESIAQAVVQEFKQADCGVLLIEPDERKIVRYGRSGPYAVDARNTLYLDGQGLVPEAIRTSEMLYVPDVTTDPRYLNSDSRTRSELVVPLITPRGVIGALDLQSLEVDAFSEVDRRLIGVFAERAALALENMQLNDKISRYIDELELRVTERTAELERARSHFEAIFNSSSDGKTVIKPDGTIVQSNPAFLKLIGLDADCSGELMTTVVRPQNPERFESVLQSVVTNEEPVRFEETIENRQGVPLMLDVAVYPVIVQEGVISNLVCSLRDMTRQKQLEIELRQALARARQVNELRMRIVTTVSHEFRTPLTRILTSSDLLSAYGERLSAEQRREKVNKIRAGVFDMVRILDDVLAVNDVTSDKLEFNPDWYDIVEITRDIIAKLKDTHQLQSERITFEAQELPNVWVDRFLFAKIVTELLTNALKFTINNSTIRCRLQILPDTVVISVEDSGIGIPEDDLERIFDTFYRGRNAENVQGVGLGLVVVKRAVELHNGTIEIASNLDEGTTFTVYIPRMGESESA